jgi:hypothetical protein
MAGSARQGALVAIILTLLAATGCVSESVAADAAMYHFKWWSWLWGLVAIGVAGLALARHPTTWIDGAWRPWWTFRGWGHRDLISFFGCLALALIMPMQTAGRLVVDGQGIVRSNDFGLKPTLTTSWSDIARLDFSTNDANLDVAERLKEARRKSKPSAVAVLKNGESVELTGWLVDAATPEIIRRARAAGVALVDPPEVAAPAVVDPEGADVWDDLVPNLAPAVPAADPAIPANAPPAGPPPNFQPPAGAPLDNQPPPLGPPDVQNRIDELRERHEQRMEEMRERRRRAGLPDIERPERPDFNRPAGAF